MRLTMQCLCTMRLPSGCQCQTLSCHCRGLWWRSYAAAPKLECRGQATLSSARCVIVTWPCRVLCYMQAQWPVLQITRVNPRVASASLQCVNGKALSDAFTGVIRQQDVRATEIDKVHAHGSLHAHHPSTWPC